MNRSVGGPATGASQSRMRIRSFPTAMDEKYVTTVWDVLKKAIQEIQRKNNSGLSFEELYRNAYAMVLNKHGERLYLGLRGVIEEHMHERVRPKIEESSDGRVLEALISVWNDHTVAMIMIRDILMYMDRTYITQSKVEPVYNLGLTIFRDEIIRYNKINERLRKEMLDMVANERCGQQIDWISMKHACGMLSALGIYESEFEAYFIKESTEYYRIMGMKLLVENSAAEYVIRVEQCLREEKERTLKCLEPSTQTRILEVVEAELITAHMSSVVDMDGSGVCHMLDDNLIADIRRMYTVFSRAKQGRNVICNAMSKWLRQKGEEITNPEAQSEELKKDPVMYITKLMELQDRCEVLLRDAFRQDANFKQRIYNDFTHFINLNENSAEFLTAFLDDKLKKGNRVLRDSEIEGALNKSMSLFRFLGEKDLFEHYYKRSLAKRLLTDRSVSDDCEKIMVSRLKTECGYQYTQKLELMFKDKELWGTMHNNFRESLANSEDGREKDPCEIQMRVLTSGVWPTQSVSASCRLPLSAEISFKAFSDFYTRQHNGRKLTLNTYMGTADVKAVFYNLPAGSEERSQQEEAGPSRRREVQETHKILNVSTHQMVVLMLFNDKETYTFAELASETRMPEKDLMKIMQSLSMGKASQRVLIRKGKGGKDIVAEDEFCVNDSFTSKLVRVKISTIADSSRAQPKEVAAVKERVEDDRKHEIECAIVRVMKARKRLEHNNLITEVIYQTSSRFKPTPISIKQRIEALIERDYLVRDKQNSKVYEYVS